MVCPKNHLNNCAYKSWVFYDLFGCDAFVGTWSYQTSPNRGFNTFWMIELFSAATLLVIQKIWSAQQPTWSPFKTEMMSRLSCLFLRKHVHYFQVHEMRNWRKTWPWENGCNDWGSNPSIPVTLDDVFQVHVSMARLMSRYHVWRGSIITKPSKPHRIQWEWTCFLTQIYHKNQPCMLFLYIGKGSKGYIYTF